jgi:hypothetical protein
MSTYSSERPYLTPIATCAAIALLAASCFVGEPQPRQPQSRHYVIEPPNGRDCQALGGTWAPGPVPTCTMPAISFQAGDTLTIRHNTTRLVVLRFKESPSERW